MAVRSRTAIPILAVVAWFGMLGVTVYTVGNRPVEEKVVTKTVTEEVPVEKVVTQFVDRETGKEVAPPTSNAEFEANLKDATKGVRTIRDWTQKGDLDYGDYDYGFKVVDVYGVTCIVHSRWSDSDKSNETMACDFAGAAQ